MMIFRRYAGLTVATVTSVSIAFGYCETSHNQKLVDFWSQSTPPPHLSATKSKLQEFVDKQVKRGRLLLYVKHRSVLYYALFVYYMFCI